MTAKAHPPQGARTLSPVKRTILFVTGLGGFPLVSLATYLLILQLDVAHPFTSLAILVWISLSLSFEVASLLLLLLPFRGPAVVEYLITSLISLLDVFMKLWYWCVWAVAPIAIPYFVFGLAFVMRLVLEALHVIPTMNEKGSLYVTLFVAALVYIYTAQKLILLYTRIANKEWDFTSLIDWLHPEWIRIYVYGILAIAYFIFNIERFSDLAIPFVEWTAYREVILEVLLTIAAFDAVIGLWQEKRKKK